MCLISFSTLLLHPELGKYVETSAKLLRITRMCVCVLALYHASAACRDAQSPGKVPAAPQLGHSGKDPKPKTLSPDV